MSLKQPLAVGTRIFAPAFAAMGLAVHLAAASAAVAKDRIELGRELFEHKWVPNDPLSPDGDGLGPMFNADSCVACHHLGSPGGAGSSEHNVELLSRQAPDTAASPRKKLVLKSNAGKIHAGFSIPPDGASSVLLHHFGTEPRYERWRLVVLGFKLPPQLLPSNAAFVARSIEEQESSRPPVTDLPRKNGVALQLSRRNTTALFGAGLVDSLSAATLLNLAKQQAEDNPGIEGRVARTSDGSVGRFGWRGQVSTLRGFVLSACAMELGLQNAGHAQAIDPLNPHQHLSGNDLSQNQCDALVAFVAALPAPPQLPATGRYDAELRNQGETLFESTGCSACHVRDVRNVHGIYSDLLLHDMGPALEDPLPAFPDRIKVGTRSTGSSGYGGGSVDILADVPSSVRREWKTPPLWGVRDSAPYLHDGRARTLAEAIVAHGGQAESSVKKFKGLDYLSRSHLIAFVNSLGAPEK
jgi:CxxC motif-containing protein (DUF1111 family)